MNARNNETVNLSEIQKCCYCLKSQEHTENTRLYVRKNSGISKAYI